jgi:hypothetical protein
MKNTYLKGNIAKYKNPSQFELCILLMLANGLLVLTFDWTEHSHIVVHSHEGLGKVILYLCKMSLAKIGVIH